MNKQILILIVSVFLLSCADLSLHMKSNDIGTPSSKENAQNIKYMCDPDIKLSINFISRNNNKEAIAIINGFGTQAIILPNKATASGFLYSNGKYTLRGKEEKATWTVGRMAPFQCTTSDKLLPEKNLK